MKRKFTKKKVKNVVLIFDIAIIAILVAIVALFALLFLDTAFNLGEFYVSRLALGDYSIPYKFFLIVVGIVVLTSLPSLYEMVAERVKGSSVGNSLFVIASVFGVLSIALIFPVAIFETADRDSYNIFGYEITGGEIHYFVALKMLSFFLLFIYLIFLAQFVVTVKNFDKMIQVHKVGYAVIALVTIMFLVMNLVDVNPLGLFATGTLILLLYLIYVIIAINANNKIQFQNISIRSRLLGIIIIIDLLIILFGDKADFAALIRGEFSHNPNPDPFSSTETVLIFNLLFFMAYVYLDARFKIGERIK